MESAINTQNSEITEFLEPNNLTLRSIASGHRYPTRKLSQLIDISLKPFLKHIKSYIYGSLDAYIKFPKDVGGDTKIAISYNIVHKVSLRV